MTEREELQNLIRELVAAEDKGAPVLDTDMAAVARTRGLGALISDQTIGACRRDLSIPPARERWDGSTTWRRKTRNARKAPVRTKAPPPNAGDSTNGQRTLTGHCKNCPTGTVTATVGVKGISRAVCESCGQIFVASAVIDTSGIEGRPRPKPRKDGTIKALHYSENRSEYK